MKRTLRHRHSWPPLRKPKPVEKYNPIDENPFAHFVSSLDDQSSYSESDLTAGIDDERRSRSMPPFHRNSQDNGPAASYKSSKTARLLQWIEKMEKQYLHRSPSPPKISPSKISPPLSANPIAQISPPLRGRLLQPTFNSRVRTNLRTPPRRPRAWREPSGNIWPVAEEPEETGDTDDVGLGISV
ncbi:MAG: hypothetical protein Q9190_002035 [Brigantiaea leucoxantha]